MEEHVSSNGIIFSTQELCALTSLSQVHREAAYLFLDSLENTSQVQHVEEQRGIKIRKTLLPPKDEKEEENASPNWFWKFITKRKRKP